MAGGLIQLVAQGAQDAYLTANPQVTFFKKVFRRYTNFAVEPIENQFNGVADFGKKPEVTISRNADLVSRMYLKTTVKASVTTAAPGERWAWVQRLGLSMIKNVELQIGGQKIDKHYSQWMDIWHELSGDDDHGASWDEMTGNTAFANQLKDNNTDPSHLDNERALDLFVPLYFWFNRSPGAALPLIALQYHEVKVLFEFREAEKCVNAAAALNVVSNLNPVMSSASLVVDYVYLDSNERKRFAQLSHEYLIDQVQDEQAPGGQSVAKDTTSATVRLNFNHPCKALYWINPLTKWTDGSNYFLGTDIDSASRNFVIRYCLDNLSTLGKGDTVRLIVAAGNITTLKHTSGAVTAAPAATTLNQKHNDYNKTVNALQGVSIVVSADTAATIQLDTDNKLTVAHVNTLYNGMSFSNGYLPISVLSKYIKDESASGSSTDKYDIAYANTTDSATSGAVFNTVSNPLSTTVLAQGVTRVRLYGWNLTGANLDNSGQTIKTAKLKLNGNDRFEEQNAVYFNKVQPWQAHQNGPHDGVYVYSFALDLHDPQPSGSCNFSRIDNSQLELTMNAQEASSINVYAMNHNVLRIVSGMGGLAYSN